MPEKTTPDLAMCTLSHCVSSQRTISDVDVKVGGGLVEGGMWPVAVKYGELVM